MTGKTCECGLWDCDECVDAQNIMVNDDWGPIDWDSIFADPLLCGPAIGKVPIKKPGNEGLASDLDELADAFSNPSVPESVVIPPEPERAKPDYSKITRGICAR